MIGNKSIWKRIGSGAIALCFVAALFPASAFAADSSSIFAAIYKTLNPDGSYGATFSSEELTKVEGGTLGGTMDGKIDLWVTAKEESYQIPHVEDKSGNTWYLQNISLINDYTTPTDTQLVMDADDILAADSIDDYVLDPAKVSIGTWYDTYLVCYGWTTTSPDQWGGDSNDAETYTVNYNLNCPSGVDSISTIGQNGIPPQEGEGYNGVPESVANLNGKTVQEGLNFRVADGLDDALDEDDLKGFLAYNVNNSNSQSYFFGGWKDITGDVHPCNEIVTATEDLAGENGIIQFTGVWYKIPLYSKTELENIEKSVPLNVFTSGTNGNLLISQSTDTLIKENNGISYTVSAGINGDLLSKDSGVAFKGDEFATFEIIVKVDPNLEFANLNEEGMVTLRMASNLIVPQNIEMTSGTVNWTGNDGSWTVSFDPDELPSDNDGMQIVINAAFTDKNYTNFTDKMTLTGLDFKLKEGAFDAGGVVPEVKTSANMTAKMDLSKIASTDNTRFRYFTLRNLLMNNNTWSTYFGGGVDNPTAYMHALQFLDYKLADYDLSADTTATLKANTVTAEILESEPIRVKPADITIYMGGDGGYDAVVGENGEIAPSTNSLPHPLFTIDVPDGIDPEELTFTNGGDTWTVECDNPNSAGTKYYHFVPVDDDTDDVRVTYTYTDKSGKEHTVTSDKFDPTTMGDVFAELKVELYPGTSNTSQVRAIASNGAHYVASTSGTLTIRAVEDQDATSDIQDDAPEKSVAAGSAVAVKPAGGTVYTLNNTGVRLPTESKPSLLFDSIIDDEKVNRTELLEDKADEKLGAVVGNTTRHYEIKYLDLVDANNGNAWITSSKGTYIYWGYPEGTDQSTKFTVLHFQGLHRDGNDSGYDASDITELGVDSVESIIAENTENGIKFYVKAGGFSPFALVWETTFSGGGTATGYTITAEAGNGGSISPSGSVSVTAGENQTFTITADDGYEIANVTVDNKSVGAVSSYTFENVSANHTIKAIFKEESGAADPDDTGVSDWLNTDDHAAYLSGYPNDLFGANNNMTRGEVAQMFYNLLLDKNVTITVTFEDVAADAWYADAVNTLASLGMIKGVGDNRFEPERSITRAEFTTIAMHFTNGVLEGENIFPDVNPDDWFYDYVVGSIQYGWISGYPDGTFGPNNTITRAEVTTIVNRMLGRSVDKDYVDSHTADLRQFTDLADTYWAYYDIMEATNGHEYTKIDGVEDWVRVN